MNVSETKGHDGGATLVYADFCRYLKLQVCPRGFYSLSHIILHPDRLVFFHTVLFAVCNYGCSPLIFNVRKCISYGWMETPLQTFSCF